MRHVLAAREDLDDAADRLGSVEARHRPLDDLDALDQFERDVLDRRGADGRRAHAQPIDEHQRLRGSGAANEKRLRLARAPGRAQLDPRFALQDLAERQRSGLVEILARDDHGIAQCAGRAQAPGGGNDHRVERPGGCQCGDALGLSAQAGEAREPRNGEGFHDRPSSERLASPHAAGFRLGTDHLFLDTGQVVCPRFLAWGPVSGLAGTSDRRLATASGAGVACGRSNPAYRCGGSAGVSPASRASLRSRHDTPGWREALEMTFKRAPYALTGHGFSNRVWCMDPELDVLEAKLAQLVQRLEALREENRELRQQLATRTDENSRIAEKLGAAKSRIEALLKQIPETET